MKKFKKIDVVVSILLIVASVVWACVQPNYDFDFLLGYFVVGAWQITSMIVHAISGWFCEKGSSRYYYHRLVFGIFVITVFGIVFPYLLVIFYLLLFFAPVMAVWYTCMCGYELYEKMKRPMALLK